MTLVTASLSCFLRLQVSNMSKFYEFLRKMSSEFCIPAKLQFSPVVLICSIVENQHNPRPPKDAVAVPSCAARQQELRGTASRKAPRFGTAWPGGYNRMMEIGYDPAKRDKPLKERGLDFEDIRKDYDERRWVTIGFLSGRMVVVGWPPGTRFGEFSQ